MNREHQVYSIGEISYNTKKSPGDLRIFAVTLTSVKDDQLRPEGKTGNDINNINILYEKIWTNKRYVTWEKMEIAFKGKF